MSVNGAASPSSSDPSSSSSSSVPFSRYTLIDVNRAEANQPIDLICRGVWHNKLSAIEKYDVLIISGCRVERIEVEQAVSSSSVNMKEPMECEYRMVVDDNTDSASIIVYNWRDRILARTGKLHTHMNIKGQQ
jgi:hypothetical protein